MKPYHRKSTLRDVVDMIPNIRYEDKREVQAVGYTPEQALGLSYLSSQICRSILDKHGRVVGMYGVCPIDSQIGQVWMLGTKGLLKIKTSFLRESRSEVEGMNSIFPLLCNQIDSRNKVHLRWIKWCGFKIIGEKMIGNVKFYDFCKIACP
tara:strand:+ start:1700 stop:2152 length:453 start_codon:yes stop_codon:yes gene_type:complete